MRELKFRAFNTKSNKMMDLHTVSALINLDTHNDGGVYLPLKHEHLKIMQYTGFKDSKGTEIFEGDVIAFNRTKFGEVYFSAGAWQVKTRKQIFDLCLDFIAPDEDFKVVGNVHRGKHAKKSPEYLKSQ